MRKFAQKWMVLVAVLSILAIMFAGCGKKAEDTTTTGDVTADSTDTTTPAADTTGTTTPAADTTGTTTTDTTTP